jgi:hypothetical protein
VRGIDQTPYQPWHSLLFVGQPAVLTALPPQLSLQKKTNQIEVLHLFRCSTHTQTHTQTHTNTHTHLPRGLFGNRIADTRIDLNGRTKNRYRKSDGQCETAGQRLFFLHAKEVEFRFSMSKPSRFVSRQKYLRVLLVACEAHDERCCKTREIHGNRSIVIIEE